MNPDSNIPLVEYYFPHKLSALRLDKYLASGWFRNGAILFRSKILCLEGDIYSVLNIRLRLKDYQFSKSLRKIMRKNAHFKIKINKASISPEKELLFEKHKSRFKGFIYPSLSEFFTSGSSSGTIFNTYEICVYDEDKLIAVSFFDAGKKSIASLLGLHDENYSKSSLGIYTMLLEIEYAMKFNKSYYYPGYILDNEKSFEYKLRLGKMQFYNWKGQWVLQERFPKFSYYGDLIKEKYLMVQNLLSLNKIPFTTYLYPLFTLGFVDNAIDPLLKSAIFISFKPHNKPDIILEYDIDEDLYRLMQIEVCNWINIEDIEFNNNDDDSIYPNYLKALQIENILAQTNDINSIVNNVMLYLND